MGWTNPATWLAGAALTAAQLNAQVRDNLKAIGDPWTAYTPVCSWSPGGSGTLTGRVQQAGKLVHVTVDLVLATGFTATGQLTFSLPFTPLGAYAGRPLNGAFLATDDSTGAQQYLATNMTSAGLLRPSTVGNATPVTNGAPFTVAAGDRFTGHIVYEAA